MKEGAMYRFFMNQFRQDVVTLDGEQHHHLSRVLRARPGEELELVFSDGVICRAIISSMDNDSTNLDVLEELPGHELPVHITLFQGLPKSDKMELIIRKTVELGVSAIIPLEMTNSVVRYDDKKKKGRLERWQKIAESAAKQAGRDHVPPVNEFSTIRELVGCAEQFDAILVPYEGAQSMRQTRQVLERISVGSRIAIVIGPEGGFASDEIIALREAGAEIISLGKRILRTETAGLYILSVLGYLKEEE